MSFVKISSVLCLGAMFVIVACKPTLNMNEDQHIEAEKVTKEIKDTMILDDVGQLFTPQSHPQLYQDWQKDWIATINNMIPLATKRIQAQDSCNKVSKVDMSTMSEVNVEPFLDVYCQNGEVFSVNMSHIKEQKQLYPNSKLFGKNLTDFTDACIDTIKPYFIHPNDTKEQENNTQFKFDEVNNELRMSIPITVKTGYDTELSHIVNCRANNKLQVFVQLDPMPR